ncbi:MAG: hypothetical protein A2Y97_03765 [Nitrospirae bacterium RBG_13_39_12]|nr:MAG: hypothetical protein A2Y97_03765 [Nitrospirae bacterium RBG_13_39_12]
MISGEEKAWEMILDLDPVDVCRRANVTYNRDTTSYLLKSFGFEFSISPRGREIKNLSEKGKILATRLAYVFNHSVLSYLLNAKEIPLSGRLVKPNNIKGGEFFFQGSHMLPLDKVAEKYGNDKEGFITRGKELSGRLLGYGDASLELLPLPRLPVTLILWLTDEEFPARLDILFDSTCEIQVPLDILWSIAMMSILSLL